MSAAHAAGAVDLLVEIGVEEVPAGYIPPALDQLREGLAALLAERRLQAPGGACESLGTPRRLAVIARGVLPRQEDREVVSQGPAKRAAYDAAGKPTQAALGFARGKGIAVEALEIVATEKGEYVAARVLEKGADAKALLAEALPALLGGLRFPKSMRWDGSGAVFARPIRWIVAILGADTIPVRLAGLTAGRETRGHRFFSSGVLTITSVDAYRDALRRAHVVADVADRRAAVESALSAAAASAGGRLVPDSDLIDQVTFLVEVPSALAGSFDPSHLVLPREVIETAMKAHQRYFSVEDAAGKLLPKFLSVVNVPGDDPARLDTVRRGNERVLAARLADAEFYWHEDQKTPLREKVPLLDRVVWQEALGTVGEKTRRVERLGLYLARGPLAGARDTVGRAAPLLKADLVTDMVQDGKEFTKLQGFMGREYARGSGEPEEVAQAIFEHYLPRFAGDALPATPAGAILSVADKVDTIVGCFGIGLVPTGSQDPFALRRLARGVLRILREQGAGWDLPALLDHAAAEYAGRLKAEPAKLRADVLAFFSERLKNLLAEEGIAYDAVDASLAVTSAPRDVEARARAIDSFRASPDFERLAIGFKRVSNILKGAAAGGTPDPALFQDDAERSLHDALLRAGPEVGPLVERHAYREAMEVLLGLRGVIDAFFDTVLVMAKEERLRENRLALLREVRGLFLRFADLSRIVTPGDKT